MDKPRIYRALKRLRYLLSLKQGDEEDRLAAGLLVILAIYLRTNDVLIFKKDFISELRNHYYGHVRQRVGTDHISAKMEQLIQDELTFQEEHLDGFAKDLDSSKISNQMAMARARQYAGSLGKLSNRINLELRNKQSLGEWRVNSSLENCHVCQELNGEIHTTEWYINNHVPRDGRTPCLQNCGCEIFPV